MPLIMPFLCTVCHVLSFKEILIKYGSRPDGIAVCPCGGRSFVWDCTCVDTFAGYT